MAAKGRKVRKKDWKRMCRAAGSAAGFGEVATFPALQKEGLPVCSKSAAGMRICRRCRGRRRERRLNRLIFPGANIFSRVGFKLTYLAGFRFSLDVIHMVANYLVSLSIEDHQALGSS